jgi:hypothetical protein
MKWKLTFTEILHRDNLLRQIFTISEADIHSDISSHNLLLTHINMHKLPKSARGTESYQYCHLEAVSRSKVLPVHLVLGLRHSVT